VTAGFVAPFVYMQISSAQDSKQGILLVNGRPTNFDDQPGGFKSNIAHLVQPGSNSIEIVPRSKMYVSKLEIRLERTG